MEQTGQLQQYLLSILVKNRVGVLSRISGLIEPGVITSNPSRRYPSAWGENQTRITLVVVGDPAVVEHVIRQISNLEDIVRVDKLVEEENYCMELLLVRIGVTRTTAGGRGRSPIFTAPRCCTRPRRSWGCRFPACPSGLTYSSTGWRSSAAGNVPHRHHRHGQEIERTTEKGDRPVEKHILSVLVRNNAGVLARISSLFGRRAFNIDSLTVSPTNDPRISRITMVAEGDQPTLEQIMKQVDKLEETIEIVHLPEEESFCKECLMLRIAVSGDTRDNIRELAAAYGANILDEQEDYLVLELSDVPSRVNSFLQIANNYEIIEMSRTGITAMSRITIEKMITSNKLAIILRRR